MKTCISLLLILLATHVYAQKHPLSVGVYGWLAYNKMNNGSGLNVFANRNISYLGGVRGSVMHKGFELGIGVERNTITYKYLSSNKIRGWGSTFYSNNRYISPYLFANHSLLRIGNNYFYGGAHLGYLVFLRNHIGFAKDFTRYKQDGVYKYLPNTRQKGAVSMGLNTGYNIVALQRLCVQFEAGLNYIPVNLTYLDVESDGVTIINKHAKASFWQVPISIGLVYHLKDHRHKNEEKEKVPEASIVE